MATYKEKIKSIFANNTKEKIILTLDSGLIKIESNGIDTSKLFSMLVNAISITILNASNGDVAKKDELVNKIVSLLKGE